MHRSSSASRVSDNTILSSSSSSPSRSSSLSSTLDLDPHLPTYNPLSHAAKREQHRLKLSKTAVHLIPIVLVLCAIILWFFSATGPKVNAPYAYLSTYNVIMMFKRQLYLFFGEDKKDCGGN